MNQPMPLARLSLLNAHLNDDDVPFDATTIALVEELIAERERLAGLVADKEIQALASTAFTPVDLLTALAVFVAGHGQTPSDVTPAQVIAHFRVLQETVETVKVGLALTAQRAGVEASGDFFSDFSAVLLSAEAFHASARGVN